MNSLYKPDLRTLGDQCVLRMSLKDNGKERDRAAYGEASRAPIEQPTEETNPEAVPVDESPAPAPEPEQAPEGQA